MRRSWDGRGLADKWRGRLVGQSGNKSVRGWLVTNVNE